MNLAIPYRKAAQNWQEAFQIPGFFRSVLIWFFIMSSCGALYPYFFDYLQHRPGTAMMDPLLDLIPPRDLSIPIFLAIYTPLVYVCIRALYDPGVFSAFVINYSLMLLFRVITLWLTPLYPPEHLVPLQDPVSFQFYGQQVVTRDLFFSGHTATSFMVFVSLPFKKERLVIMVMTVILGIMLLIQHIHYSIDVISAFPIAYACYRLGRRFNLHQVQSDNKKVVQLKRSHHLSGSGSR
jgi:hypothetical protein